MRYCRSRSRRSPLAELKVRVTPKSSRNAVEAGTPFKVYVTVPPSDGEANRAVVETVAKALSVAKSKVTIVRGQTSRDKTLDIQGMTEEELAMAISALS